MYSAGQNSRSLREGLSSLSEGLASYRQAGEDVKASERIRQSELGSEDQRESLASDVRAGRVSASQAQEKLEPGGFNQMIYSLFGRIQSEKDPQKKLKLMNQMQSTLAFMQMLKGATTASKSGEGKVKNISQRILQLTEKQRQFIDGKGSALTKGEKQEYVQLVKKSQADKEDMGLKLSDTDMDKFLNPVSTAGENSEKTRSNAPKTITEIAIPEE